MRKVIFMSGILICMIFMLHQTYVKGEEPVEIEATVEPELTIYPVIPFEGYIEVAEKEVLNDNNGGGETKTKEVDRLEGLGEQGEPANCETGNREHTYQELGGGAEESGEDYGRESEEYSGYESGTPEIEGGYEESGVSSEFGDSGDGGFGEGADSISGQRADEYVKPSEYDMAGSSEGVDNGGGDGSSEETWSDDRGLTYLGEWTSTAYCPCELCCGVWATGCTASGVLAEEGRTVACGGLPFGTRLMINDHIYTVEDRGVDGEWVDIFFSSHEAASAYGLRTVSVYLVE